MDYIARSVLEKHIGQAVLTCLDRLSPEELERETQETAQAALQQIWEAVNDLEQDDFMCLDTIVDILVRCGYPVKRHDF